MLLKVSINSYAPRSTTRQQECFDYNPTESIRFIASLRFFDYEKGKGAESPDRLPSRVICDAIVSGLAVQLT